MPTSSNISYTNRLLRITMTSSDMAYFKVVLTCSILTHKLTLPNHFKHLHSAIPSGMATTVLWQTLSIMDFTTKQEHPHINGLHYYTKCVTFIWQTVLKQWKLRNQHLHPTTTLQEDRTQLQAIVNQIIHDANQDPNLQALVANVTTEQVMNKPIRKLCQWITNSNTHIRNYHKAAQLQAKLKTRDI